MLLGQKNIMVKRYRFNFSLLEGIEMKKKCNHRYRIFKDTDSKGFLTFYCENCLDMVRKDKKFSIDDMKQPTNNPKLKEALIKNSVEV
jgi:hypothetical protein